MAANDVFSISIIPTGELLIKLNWMHIQVNRLAQARKSVQNGRRYQTNLSMLLGAVFLVNYAFCILSNVEKLEGV